MRAEHGRDAAARAATLARRGIRLEASTLFPDRIRGEGGAIALSQSRRFRKRTVHIARASAPMRVFYLAKKSASLLCWLVLVDIAALPAAAGERVPFDASASIGFHNQYNFRGFKAGDWAPSLAVDFFLPAGANSALAVDLGGWYVDPIDDVYNELGLYAFLLVPVEDFHFRVGGIFFAFPDEDWVTGEFGVAVSHPVLDIFDLELAWWSDVKGRGFAEDELRFGHYAELGVRKSIGLTNWLDVDLAAGVSYAIHYYDSDGWNHAFATLGFPIGLSETFTLTPYVGGTLALEGLRDAGEHDQFLAGVLLSVGF